MATGPENKSKRRLKPPPNYNTRKMQAKMFLLVVACMGVISLATWAADPQQWAFFGTPAVEAPATAPEHVDSRLEGPAEVSPQEADVVRITDPFRGSLDDVAALEANDPVARALADGWSAFFEQASRDEHDLVAKALIYAAKPAPLPEADTSAWNVLLDDVERFWAGYRENAWHGLQAATKQVNEREEAKPLSEEERATWKSVLDKVDEAWQADREVFAKLAQPGELTFTTQEQERLRLWQLRWERFSLAAIKDDTVHRPAEADAWFRLFDVLNHTPQADVDRQPATPVTFVQLFKQSPEYRGKLVRFHGRIMQAKRIKATRNVYGIEHLYLLWVAPTDKADMPIMVTALEMPEGFPALVANEPGGYMKMREDVVVTGYFFKRWAYLSKQGTRTAPLILAKAPHWIPSTDVTQLRGVTGGLPSLSLFAGILMGCTVLGVAFAVFVYRASRDRSSVLETLENDATSQRMLADSLSGASAGPNTLESLRQLEDRDREGKH